MLKTFDLKRRSKRRSKSRPIAPGRRSRLEVLEPRMLLTGAPYGAVEQDTAEYMLGDVVVSVVLFESDGSIDVSTEDWNELQRDGNGDVVFDGEGRTISLSGPNLIEQAKDRVVEGLQWWEDTLENFYEINYDDVAPIHSLNFIYDFEYTHNPVVTGYEPISRISNDFVRWVPDFLRDAGHLDTGWIDIDIRSFNDAQRMKYDADWAYTIFVVNDNNDDDGRFKLGGSFTQAFAYSGGRFLVSPAGRPASTFSHETGHIFYAKDEYANAGTYTDQRGYYNTQNWNAWDNPEPGFVQQPSIMDARDELDIAWATNVSSDSSWGMIGWQDSDGDGVFDVLDVPLTLTGSGYYDPVYETYHFSGQSAAQTLPNINSSGRRNDITINEVSEAVYSLDGGASWIVAGNYDTYEADINLAISVEPGQELLIRTQSIDPGTGQIVVTSEETFYGTTSIPTAVADSGIHGFVWYDRDDNGLWSPGERGVSGWTLQLIDDQNQPLETSQHFEPDDYDDEEVINNALSGITLTAIGYDAKDGRVGALDSSVASTGDRVFGLVRLGAGDSWVADWTDISRNLRIDFDTPTTYVSLDAIAPSSGSFGRLAVYDSDDNLLGRYTTGQLQDGEVETMSFGVATPRIAYVVASSTVESTIRLDNLRIGPESTAISDALGAYSITNLPSGSYRVMAVASEYWDVVEPVDSVREVVVDADGNMQWLAGTDRPSDFAGQPDPTAPPWRNPINPLDVNDDIAISPIDALLVINDLNANGSRELPAPGDAPPPFIDVTGDGFVSPLDALVVINYLNAQASGGLQGPSGQGGSGEGGSGEGGSGEGESWFGQIGHELSWSSDIGLSSVGDAPTTAPSLTDAVPSPALSTPAVGLAKRTPTSSARQWSARESSNRTRDAFFASLDGLKPIELLGQLDGHRSC